VVPALRIAVRLRSGALSLKSRLLRGATGKLCKRDHFLGKDPIFRGLSAAGNDRYPPEARAALSGDSATGDQIEDQDDECDNEQQMNQATGYVKAETQNPQKKKNHENCPKHMLATFPVLRTPETGSRPRRAQFVNLVTWMQSPAPLRL